MNEINVRVQNLFRTLQNDPKTIFYTINNWVKLFQIKQKKQLMIKIKYLQIYTNTVGRQNFFWKKWKLTTCYTICR